MSKYENLKDELEQVIRNREGTSKLLRDLSMNHNDAYDTLEMCMHVRINPNNGFKTAMVIHPNLDGNLTDITRTSYLKFLEDCYEQFTDRKNYITKKLKAIETLLDEEQQDDL